MGVNGSHQTPPVRRLLRVAITRPLAVLLGFVVLTGPALLAAPIVGPSASADPCPDVEVMFARGTFEPPGVGAMGQEFVDAVRSQPQLAGKSVDVYPVNYPASLDFSTAADGVIDASNKVRAVAANCPDTKIVLGGYSQGAAVIGYITADALPADFTPPLGITGPMPTEIANHVAAVALFGKPSNGFLNMVDRSAPPVTVGSLYTAKTIEQCVAEDPICSPTGSDGAAHGAYAVNGMIGQAADFVAHTVVAAKNSGSPVQDLSGRH